MSCRRCVAPLGLRAKALLRTERCAAPGTRRAAAAPLRRRSRARAAARCAGQDQPGVAQEGRRRRLQPHLQHGAGLVRAPRRPSQRATQRTHAVLRTVCRRTRDHAAALATPQRRCGSRRCACTDATARCVVPVQRRQRQALGRAARHAVPRQEQLHGRRDQANCQRGCVRRLRSRAALRGSCARGLTRAAAQAFTWRRSWASSRTRRSRSPSPSPCMPSRAAAAAAS